MKLATYHRRLGDEVVFYKGPMKAFIINQIYEECIARIELVQSADWHEKEILIKQYIKTKKKAILPSIITDSNPDGASIKAWLAYYADYYKKKIYREHPQWDRVCVTTLFTFYWKQTIETIEFAKYLVKDLKDLLIGGVMASLLPKEIEAATGIKPHKGLLDKAGILDDNDIIIDDLPLDYSILHEIGYRYPTGSAYFTFMTKGCTRKCAFCSVPILEPTYKDKVETIDKFKDIKATFGEQQNLLLMDNNVLASPKFPEIIDEIKEMGFYKGANFIPPNPYEIAIKNLRRGYNKKAYIKNIFYLLNDLFNTRLKRRPRIAQKLYTILLDRDLLDLRKVTEANILESYELIAPIFEKYREKSPKRRYVDFNQGTDARYVTDALMAKMSEIPIRPLRIAFDYIGMKKQYINAVELAAKYKIKELSNYLLYNFKDKPEDLYNRMLININLGERLGVKIFSFPMKYIPLFGEDAKHRNYIGKYWNRKFIRAIQSVLNVTKGIVASGRKFFLRAFGDSIESYYEILYMPETYIVYRSIFEDAGLTKKWREAFGVVKDSPQWPIVKEIIESNDFSGLPKKIQDERLLGFFVHYQVSKEEVKGKDNEVEALREKYCRLIKADFSLELTLTYDFE